MSHMSALRERYEQLCAEPPARPPRPPRPPRPTRPAPRPSQPPPRSPLLEEVAQLLGTAARALTARNQAAAASRARQEAMWLLAQLGVSESHVARLLQRDRATVRYGRTATEIARAASPSYAQRLDDLAARLKGGAS